MNSRPSRIFAPTVAIVALAVSLLMAHSPILLSGFARMQSDPGDPRLNNYILEHGYLKLAGAPNHRHFSNPPMFYPHQNAIAYGDLLLGLAPPYWAARAAGLAPDTSFQVWMLAVSTLHFLAAWLVLRRAVRVGALGSAVGAMFISVAASRTAHMGHQQLICLFWPLLALYAAWRLVQMSANDQPCKAGRWSAVAMVALFFGSFVAQFYTGFYNAFFMGLCTAIALAWGLLLRRDRPATLALFRKYWLLLAAGAVLSAIVLYPGVRHYRAAAKEVGVRPASEIRDMLPRPWSWFYMGGENWLYGWSADALPLRKNLKMQHEHQIGLGLLTPALCLAGLLMHRRRGIVLLLLLLAATIIVLSTRVLNDVCAWWGIFYGVPGGRAIRAVTRIGMLLAVPAGAGLALLVDHMQTRNWPWRTLVLLLVAGCVMEQGRKLYSYDKQAIRDDVARIASRIDPACKAFFYEPYGDKEPEWKGQLDAMWAGLAAGKPTINGYAGNLPPGWRLYQNRIVSIEDTLRIEAAFDDWLRINGLNRADICRVGYDPAKDIAQLRTLSIAGTEGRPTSTAVPGAGPRSSD